MTSEKSRTGRKLVIFILIGICSSLFLSCGDRSSPPPAPSPTVPVIEIPAKTVVSYQTYPASIQGTISSQVRAKVPGYITEVLVDEGQRVRKGQVLFRLETQSLSKEADAARANVNVAQVEVDKLKPLVEKDIISAVQLETAQARLAQARATLSSINANIGYATIRSPVNGHVGGIAFREGALISPADPRPLTTVSDIDEVYAFFSMNEREYLDFIQTTDGKTLSDKIRNFPAVELELVNGSIYERKGRIGTVTGQVDASTGTVSFRATFPNPDRLLSNGNSGRIRIPKTFDDVPVIPSAATFEQQGRVYVFKVQADTVAKLSEVSVKQRIDDLIVVGQGVNPGELIVASGVGKLRDGSTINPELVSFDSIANSLSVVFK